MTTTTTTPSPSAHGLMAFWSTIDTPYLLRYQQWHNCEHMPERVSTPGFLSGRRYRALSNAPRFLMFYETASTATLASPAYMAKLNAPTPWTREALAHFREPVRSIYSLVGSVGAPGAFAAGYVTTIRFDLPEGGEEAYARAWAAAACEAESVQRVRLYRADDAVSNLGTSERKIYGGGPGKQAYLVMVEQVLPPGEGGREGAVERADRVVEVPGWANEVREEFWLECAHRKVDGVE